MQIYQVDSFSREHFKGNPAGVCLLDKDVTTQWMQNVAMEMNLSETAFLLPVQEGFKIRFFTPANEVDLCGHATLASAHILYEQGLVCRSKEILFYANPGMLQAKTCDNAQIQLNFPAYELSTVDDALKQEISQILPWEIVDIFKTQRDVLVCIREDQELASWHPSIQDIPGHIEGGLLVTAKSSQPEYDFISRCFFPVFGIDEDPVTGSAHCALAPYWAKVLQKNSFRAFQASPRGGELGVVLSLDRVLISGAAKTFLSGHIVL